MHSAWIFKGQVSNFSHELKTGVDMDKKTCAKIASVVLFVHGFIEVIGAALMPFAPAEFLSTGFQEKLVFWAVLSAIYGLSRLVAGYGTWSVKKWGIVFGMALSITTMIGAPSIYPFGLIDLPLAVIVLAFLLYAWFGGEKL
jgi:hypothetical protein